MGSAFYVFFQKFLLDVAVDGVDFDVDLETHGQDKFDYVRCDDKELAMILVMEVLLTHIDQVIDLTLMMNDYDYLQLSSVNYLDLSCSYGMVMLLERKHQVTCYCDCDVVEMTLVDFVVIAVFVDLLPFHQWKKMKRMVT